MSKLIRRKKEIGAALILALQLTTLTVIGLMAPFASGPQQSANAPADAQMSAPRLRPKPLRLQRQPPHATPCVLRLSLQPSYTSRSPRRYLIWPPAVLSQRDNQPNSQSKGPKRLTQRR